jgi:hypothetical protein
LLYRVVRVGDDPPYCEMARAILAATKTKSRNFLHRAVRHLLVFSPGLGWSVEEGAEVLKLCSGVVNLCIVGHLAHPRILPILAEMHLQQLGGSLSELFDYRSAVDLTHRMFAHITHLDIFDHMVDTQSSAQIPILPALTHLCLNNNVPWDVIQTVLAECKKLDILANIWDSDFSDRARERAQDVRVDDVRFVVGLYTDYLADWEAGARGRPNVWTKADDFVARKRRGEIEGDSSVTRRSSSNVPVLADCYWFDT